VKAAEHPFQFVTASYLTRIGNHCATTLSELRAGLEACSDACIFYHTFQSLERHHYLTEGFSNDFAQWVLAALNRAELAEQLAAPDIRGYLSLADLRADLLRAIDEFCLAHPQELERRAFEPFYFMESVEVTVPMDWPAQTLAEFRQGLERLGHASFHFHFLVSRLRLHLRSNDFSQWFANDLDLQSLAQRTNQIDIYTNTLESARTKLVQYIDRELTA
jgi:Family of unknown function (DUF5752)